MKKLKLNPSQKEIPVEEGQTILAALEKAGYALPNNCRAGACGECKAKINCGEIDQGFVLDMALPRSEREAGYGLMCMAKPVSDVVELEYGTVDALPKLFPPREHMPYMVIEKTLVTPSIAKLKLRSLGQPLKFWPGQYVTLGDKHNGIPERCYSIANIPNSEGDILLFVTLIPQGKTSQWIHQKVTEGDTINLNGPYGTFIGNPSSELPVLCLAAGSGLAPIQSLATAAMLRGGFKYPATVIFSAKTSRDLFEVGHFKFLMSKFRNFQFKYTLTREKNENGLNGRIPDLLTKTYPSLENYSIYIAGSTEFVNECISVCKNLGALDQNLYTEGFTPQT